MAAPTEHKTVQARILKYAQEIGWKFVSRGDAEARRGFDPDGATPEDRARTASLYFGDLLHAQVRAFNPKYKEAEGALVGEFARLNADIAGNRDLFTYLRDHTLLQAIARVNRPYEEDWQTSTAEALAELLKEIEKNEQRKKEQAAKGLDGLTYFVLCKLTDDGIPNPEPVSKKVREAFGKFSNWQRSEAELREVRKQVTFAIFAEEAGMAKVTATVDALFVLLQKSFRP
jgi:type I restriction enzyme R subunit